MFSISSFCLKYHKLHNSWLILAFSMYVHKAIFTLLIDSKFANFVQLSNSSNLSPVYDHLLL